MIFYKRVIICVCVYLCKEQKTRSLALKPYAGDRITGNFRDFVFIFRTRLHIPNKEHILIKN